MQALGNAHDEYVLERHGFQMRSFEINGGDFFSPPTKKIKKIKNCFKHYFPNINNLLPLTARR